MEHVRKGLSATGSKPVLIGGAGFVFDIWAVHYTYQTPLHADNDELLLGMSTAIADQQEGGFLPGGAVRDDDPSVYFFTHAIWEKPTDVGLAVWEFDRWYPMPKPFRVPWIALVAFFTNLSGPVGVELFFDRVQVSQKEIARLVLDVGGAARST